jgi:glycerol kinase
MENMGEFDKEDCVFGTIDTWIIYNLTKGKTFATDVSNASRTFFMNLESMKWDDDILKAFGLENK